MTDQTSELTLADLDYINDAYRSRDVDAVMDTFTDDAVFMISRGSEPWGTKFEGKDQIRPLFEKRFSSKRNMRWEHQGKWIAGDRVVLQFIVFATLDNGEEIQLHGCDLMQMRGNKVAVKDTYWKSNEPPL